MTTTYVDRLERETKAKYQGRPIVQWADLTPETAVRGHKVSWVDSRGRRSVGLIGNAFPGYVSVSPLEVEGLDFAGVCSFSGVALRWPQADFYSPEQLRNARSS